MPHPALSRLSVRTLSTDCYEELKRAIITLELPPGSALVESTIAAQLGVSKTPLREALRQLAVEGLVVIQPSRTSYVAELALADVRQLLRTRLIIEPAAIRHLPRPLNAADLSELDGLVDAAAAALDDHDLAGYVELGERFHGALIDRHANDQLSAIGSRLFAHSQRIWSAVYRADQTEEQQQRSQAGIRNHRQIVAALGSGDLDRAGRMLEVDIALFIEFAEDPAVQEVLQQASIERRQ